MSENIDIRLGAVEKEVAVVKEVIRTEINLVRGDFEAVIERHSSVLERIADKIELALRFQRDSLPIGLVMKLFTFFTGLVIVLLGAILGIKWLASDVFDGTYKRDNIQQEQSQ